VVRTSLLPGLLKTVCANKHVPLPIKIFEIADIVLKDDTVERRSRNQRMFSAIYCSKTSGFEVCTTFLFQVYSRDFRSNDVNAWSTPSQNRDKRWVLYYGIE
jgi:phenylalanyl-tRNA synthetase beta chain